jgi:hypothetical protein
MERLADFYRRIRPPGFWGPVRKVVLAEHPDTPIDSFGRDLACLGVIMLGLHSLYGASCYACTKVWSSFAVSCGTVAVCTIVLYFLWYKNLPDKDEAVIPELQAEAKSGEGN